MKPIHKLKALGHNPLMICLIVLVGNVLLISLFILWPIQYWLPPPFPYYPPLHTLLLCMTCLFGLVAIFLFYSRIQDTNWLIILSILSSFEVLFVISQIFYTATYANMGLLTAKNIVTHDKWDALYFSIITWTTTGYGDYVPTIDARWCACGEALLGTFFNGFVLATVIFHLNNMPSPKDKSEARQ